LNLFEFLIKTLSLTHPQRNRDRTYVFGIFGYSICRLHNDRHCGGLELKRSDCK